LSELLYPMITGAYPVSNTGVVDTTQNLLAANDELTVSIVNDDFVTTELLSSRAGTESIGQYEVEVCVPVGKTINTDAKAQTFFFSSQEISYLSGDNSQVSPMEPATVDDDYTLIENTTMIDTAGVSNIGYCQTTSLLSIVDDNKQEQNEWLSINIMQTSICNGGRCFGETIPDGGIDSLATYSDFNTEGFIIIANNDYEIAKDTGNDKCINIDASPAVTLGPTTATPCISTSMQDVEVEHNKSTYTYVDTDGIPIKKNTTGDPSYKTGVTSYACIHDENTGSLWLKNISPLLAGQSSYQTAGTDQWKNSGANSNFLNGNTFTGYFSAVNTCGVSNAGVNKWQLPSVQDLIGILEFGNLDDSTEFDHQETYWTRDTCSSATSTNRWVVNMETSEVSCVEEGISEQHYIHAVYY